MFHAIAFERSVFKENRLKFLISIGQCTFRTIFSLYNYAKSEMSNRQTDTRTQDKYRNPCACAPRVKNTYIYTSWSMAWLLSGPSLTVYTKARQCGVLCIQKPDLFSQSVHKAFSRADFLRFTHMVVCISYWGSMQDKNMEDCSSEKNKPQLCTITTNHTKDHIIILLSNNKVHTYQDIVHHLLSCLIFCH